MALRAGSRKRVLREIFNIAARAAISSEQKWGRCERSVEVRRSGLGRSHR
jgi:hypothetical protein